MIIQQTTKRKDNKFSDGCAAKLYYILYYHFIKSYINVLLLLQQCASESTFIKLIEAWKYDSKNIALYYEYKYLYYCELQRMCRLHL